LTCPSLEQFFQGFIDFMNTIEKLSYQLSGCADWFGHFLFQLEMR
jgi:hypothetical protein